MRNGRHHNSIRILLVDDHDIVRAGIRAVLKSFVNYEVDEASNGAEAISKAIVSKPNIVVLDYSLPLVNGVEVARQIHAKLPNTEMLMFTVHNTDQVIEEALRAGVRGYVLKSDGAHELIGAINCLAVHRPYFTNGADALMSRFQMRPNQTGSVLTERERAVVVLVAEGYSNRQIGKAFNINEATVEQHRASASRKLQLSSSAELVRYAVRNKLVKA